MSQDGKHTASACAYILSNLKTINVNTLMEYTHSLLFKFLVKDITYESFKYCKIKTQFCWIAVDNVYCKALEGEFICSAQLQY